MIAGAPIIGVGTIARIIKHHEGDYRALSVPKSAIPQQLWAVKEVIMVVATPQSNFQLVVQAKKWVEKRHHIYYIVRKPYSDYFKKLAEQGVREIVLLQIIPGGGRA